MNKIKNLIKTIIGFIQYHFLPKKKFVLILSTVRSGSTLLKALISEAPEVTHINEKNFFYNASKYITYFQYNRSQKGSISILKMPSHLDNFQDYPKIPNISVKKILLVRNPIDTAISIINMKKALGQNITVDEFIAYWITTHNNLKNIINPNEIFLIKYEDLVENPLKVTKQVYIFIGSKKTEGTLTYSKPVSGKWEWGIDDGGEVIKQMKVVQYDKDYSKYDSWIERIKNSDEVMELVRFFDLKMPV
jgi:hypothetical protein